MRDSSHARGLPEFTTQPASTATGAQTPIELEGTKQREPFKVAAGLKAIEETLEYGVRHSGLFNTAAHVSQAEPDGRLRLPELRVAESGRRAELRRVLREWLQGRHLRGDHEAARRADFFKEHSVAELLEKPDHWLGHQGRLTEPMVLRPGATHYEPIAWDAAFQLMAEELKALASPNEAVFYTSGRTSNETAFLYQLFARAFGTNNLPDCSNMCHESTSVALPPMIGIGKGCVKLSDFDEADAIFIMGQNPGTNHPRMLTSLQQAKERGCKIVSVNPLPETGLFRFKNPQDLMHPLKMPRFFLGKGTLLTDLWLPVTINGDMAFLHGLMKELLEEEDRQPGKVFDHDFIKHYTAGYDELIAQLRATTWEADRRGLRPHARANPRRPRRSRSPRTRSSSAGAWG